MVHQVTTSHLHFNRWCWCCWNCWRWSRRCWHCWRWSRRRWHCWRWSRRRGHCRSSRSGWRRWCRRWSLVQQHPRAPVTYCLLLLPPHRSVFLKTSSGNGWKAKIPFGSFWYHPTVCWKLLDSWGGGWSPGYRGFDPTPRRRLWGHSRPPKLAERTHFGCCWYAVA